MTVFKRNQTGPKELGSPDWDQRKRRTAKLATLTRTLLCLAPLSVCAWGASVQATTQYDLHSGGGCCPSVFDQSTVQVTPTQTAAEAAVSRLDYVRADAIAQFSPSAGIRLSAFSYAHTSNDIDPSIGGAAVWAGTQAYAGFFDDITVLAGPDGSIEWTFALHGTLTSSPSGCGVITNGPYSTNLCSANIEVLRWRQGVGGESVVRFSAVDGTQVIDQLVTVSVPFIAGVAQSAGVGLVASSVCDGGGPLPPYRDCESLSDFYSTATLVGFHVRDLEGNVVDNDVVVIADSGFDYFSVNVPEPSSFVLLVSGLAIGLWRHLAGPRGNAVCGRNHYR